MTTDPARIPREAVASDGGASTAMAAPCRAVASVARGQGFAVAIARTAGVAGFVLEWIR